MKAIKDAATADDRVPGRVSLNDVVLAASYEAFVHGAIDWSVPLAVPPLAWLALRMGWLFARGVQLLAGFGLLAARFEVQLGLVRDRAHRGLSAAETIERWRSVRRGERLHIFPYQDLADAVFDTSLVYELSVLKVYAERYLLEVPRDHPSMGVAYSLLQLLDPFVTIYPDQVPSTSILREFIGGSAFDY